MPSSQALWYVAHEKTDLRSVDVPPPANGEVTVRALYSGLSRGTERLIFTGQVPPGEYERMRCPMQEGDFPFPVKYGYALVGKVESGDATWRGRTVFTLHPHQRHANIPVSNVHPVPEAVPPRRACLAANMETALNVIWDADIAVGQKILVIGGGVLGLLIAALADQVPGTRVTVADILPERAAVAARMGAAFAHPDAAPADQDVVIHTSATEAGLIRALACAAFEGKIVEASWFGDRTVSLPLGQAFHSRRLKILSSQVGSVAPSRRSEWTHARRLQRALDLLNDPKFDLLVTAEIPFTDAPRQLPNILTGDSSDLMTVLRY